MSLRPEALDLSGTDKMLADATSPRSRMHFNLPSPRAGEIPPALSPLDAFAQQSRLLAKRFEESQQQGRRMSRLDHLEVASEFGKRPNYFRSLSSTRVEEDTDVRHTPATPRGSFYKSSTPNIERPVSQYPLFGVAGSESTSIAPSRDPFRVTPPAPSVQPADNYFGIPRASSPEAYEVKAVPPSPKVPSLSGSIDSLHSSQARTNTDDSYKPGRRIQALPVSPTPPVSKKGANTIRSIADTGDDELLPPPKFSNNAYPIRARSPYTPDIHTRLGGSRSPSIRSDHSAFQDEFRRPSFNFSRPMSGASNKDFYPHRRTASQQTHDSDHPVENRIPRSPLSPPPQFQFVSQAATPERGRPSLQQDASSQSGDEHILEHTPLGAPSYIYAKYSLPRGRTIDRSSLGANGLALHDSPREISQTNSPDLASAQGPSQRPLPPWETGRSISADGRDPEVPKTAYHHSTPSSPSVYSQSTDKTIRGHTRNSPSQDIANMSPEQHLEKGIECHSSGSLSKSTYHLRLAAKGGNPTGMLLYALACRHGWGVRANPNEGVQWLKKAVELSSPEMLEIDESRLPAHERVEAAQKSKSRKAQFALAIYELGMSYMNGWGTPKDKALAVRCFEVAGSWGDVDAMAEAAFCYTQGVGCKKDVKKAAGLYRRAADAGMSMAGNSWIYKDKYMDEVAPSPNPSTGDKAAKANRSRARSIFGRKKG